MSKPRLPCTICAKNGIRKQDGSPVDYNLIQGLQKHLRTVHLNEYENARSKKTKKFFCDCGKSYASKQSLWDHLRRADGSQCKSCPRGYHSKALHMLTCVGQPRKVEPPKQKVVVVQEPEQDNDEENDDDECEEAFRNFFLRGKRKREEEDHFKPSQEVDECEYL